MYDNTINDVEQLYDYYDKIPKISKSDIKYTINCAREFFKRLPYKVGKEVILTKTPTINEEESWGWLGSKHFLIKGATGEVSDVYLSEKGKVIVGVNFHNQTDLHYKTKKETPRKRPGIFYFSEDWLVCND